jgi:hypothetical protein
VGVNLAFRDLSPLSAPGRSVSQFYRQTGFQIARKATILVVFGAPHRRAWEIIEFSAESHGVDTRLIQCWHANKQNPITRAAHVLSDSPPKVLTAFRGFLSRAVT